MMNLRLVILMPILLGGCHFFHPLERDKGSEEILKRAATYSFGQSREDLTKLADLVRDSQNEPARRAALAHTLAAALEEDTPSKPTLDAKQFICRQLALIGGKDEVPPLAEMLDDDETSDMARYALERIPDPAANRALRSALGEAKGKTKIGIINSLGERRDDDSVSALAKLISDKDPAIAYAAATALGKIGGPKSANALADAKPSATAANARLNCAEKFLADKQPAEAEKIYESLNKPDQPRGVRAAALQGLVSARGEKSIPLVIEALQTDDPKMRGLAARLIREMPGESATTKAFAAQLPKLKPEAAAAVVRSLARRGDDAALPAVMAAAKSSNADLRLAAIESLADLGDPGDMTTIRLLAQYAAEASPSERAAARKSLASLKGPHIDAKMTQAMVEHTGAGAPQIEVIRALGTRKAVIATNDLLGGPALSPDPAIRTETFKALAQIAETNELGRLTERLNAEKDQSVRVEAENAVVAVVSKNADKEGRAEPLLAALGTAGDPVAKASLLRVLGKLEGEKSLSALRGALADKQPEIQSAAITALSGWSDPAPADDLLKLMKSSPEGVARAEAFKGYGRLAALPASGNEKARLALMKNALKLAKNADEKRAILFPLRDVLSLDALQLAESYFTDRDVKPEAIETASKIAFWISGSYPDDVRSAMKRVLEITDDKSARENANLVLGMVDKFEDYITAWEVSGPYKEKGKDGYKHFDIVFPPEDPNAKGVEWKTMPASGDPGRPWLLDLGKAVGGDHRAAYLRTNVWAPKELKAKLEIGSDDGVKVWVNGAVVHANNATRSLKPAEDTAEATLKQGWNAILMKVNNGGGDWQACLRLRAADGSKIEGLRAEAGGAK
ncbi:HEAT repeat domain-containing protein [Candidatus Sumerlaeota bacterium]|nr:HEAT repeat domain-containing protein [Candidatus Sumerlaeota bacterium]